ncbi:hypothetical protein [Actinacidiphila sp. ITFR-21]|uniref:hypothetical protein n=1 Tax=Actinacidiphila sp. ITFR-21 TaxID=3075199 RepID=UPI00288AFFF4|nr:hypothetical protein [Streptomyces sp. ITFR-21]WNI15223.1 hypothetical protein RLT57_06520 [Streptomyces sp. ITFR-21]
MTDMAELAYHVTVAALEGDRDTLAAYLATTPGPITTAAVAELAVMTMASVITGVLTPQQLADIVEQVRGFARERANFNKIIADLTEGN